MRAVESVSFDLLLGRLELDFLNNVNIGKTLKNTNINIAKLNRRKNKKWASKQISILNKEFNDLLSLKIYEEMANGLIGIGANSFVEKMLARVK